MLFQHVSVRHTLCLRLHVQFTPVRSAKRPFFPAGRHVSWNAVPVPNATPTCQVRWRIFRRTRIKVRNEAAIKGRGQSFPGQRVSQVDNEALLMAWRPAWRPGRRAGRCRLSVHRAAGRGYAATRLRRTARPGKARPALGRGCPHPVGYWGAGWLLGLIACAAGTERPTADDTRPDRSARARSRGGVAGRGTVVAPRAAWRGVPAVQVSCRNEWGSIGASAWIEDAGVAAPPALSTRHLGPLPRV